jgi:hypothetical protein
MNQFNESSSLFTSIYIHNTYSLTRKDIRNFFETGEGIGKVRRIDFFVNEKSEDKHMSALVHLDYWFETDIAYFAYDEIVQNGSVKLFYAERKYLILRKMTCEYMPDTELNIHQLAHKVQDLTKRVADLETQLEEKLSAEPVKSSALPNPWPFLANQPAEKVKLQPLAVPPSGLPRNNSRYFPTTEVYLVSSYYVFHDPLTTFAMIGRMLHDSQRLFSKDETFKFSANSHGLNYYNITCNGADFKINVYRDSSETNKSFVELEQSRDIPHHKKAPFIHWFYTAKWMSLPNGMWPIVLKPEDYERIGNEMPDKEMTIDELDPNQELREKRFTLDFNFRLKKDGIFNSTGDRFFRTDESDDEELDEDACFPPDKPCYLTAIADLIECGPQSWYSDSDEELQYSGGRPKIVPTRSNARTYATENLCGNN